MRLFGRGQHGREKQVRHPRIGFDVVEQQIVHRLEAPRPEPPFPRPLHRLGRRRHHEEQEHRVAETGQQTAGPHVVLRRVEAVEPEPVDQQMRHRVARGLGLHVAVELAVDDLELLPGQHRRVFVILAKAFIIEQELAPVIRADEREILPWHAELLGQRALGRADRALARRRRALDVEEQRLLLHRQEPIALGARGFFEDRRDHPPDLVAAPAVADHVAGEIRDRVAIRHQPAPLCHDPARDRDERRQTRGLERIVHARLQRPAPLRDRRVLARLRRPDGRGRRLAASEQPPEQSLRFRRSARLRRNGRENLRVEQRAQPRRRPTARRLEFRAHLVHARSQVIVEDLRRHPAQADPQILVIRPVRHRQVRRHPDQQLVRHQPFRPRRHHRARLQPAERRRLAGLREPNGRILRPVERRERHQPRRNVRFETRMPRVAARAGLMLGRRLRDPAPVPV